MSGGRYRGQPFDLAERVSCVFVRRDGRWRCVLTHLSQIAERFWLWVLAAVGLLGINGVFLWTLYTRPDKLLEALANPLALAFGWGWFVALSLLGSLAFAIPIALLLPRRDS